MTTASETPPASERSKPPCWTTSNCPRPTIAMRAANGRLPSKAPYDRLDGANRRQMLISAIVEITTVTNSLDNGTWKPCRESAPAPIGSLVAFIQPFSRPAISALGAAGQGAIGDVANSEAWRRRAHGLVSRLGPTGIHDAISSVTLT